MPVYRWSRMFQEHAKKKKNLLKNKYKSIVFKHPIVTSSSNLHYTERITYEFEFLYRNTLKQKAYIFWQLIYGTNRNATAFERTWWKRNRANGILKVIWNSFSPRTFHYKLSNIFVDLYTRFYPIAHAMNYIADRIENNIVEKASAVVLSLKI